MTARFERDWEARLDRELKGLGGLKAPASLSVRVLAAAATRERHWRTWAPARQAALMGAVGASAAAVVKAGGEGAGLLAPRLEAALGVLVHAQRYPALAFEVARSVWWAERLPLACAAAALYLMCVGFGTVLAQAAARPHSFSRT